jgi:hypothetical protein
MPPPHGTCSGRAERQRSDACADTGDDGRNFPGRVCDGRFKRSSRPPPIEPTLLGILRHPRYKPRLHQEASRFVDEPKTRRLFARCLSSHQSLRPATIFVDPRPYLAMFEWGLKAIGDSSDTAARASYPPLEPLLLRDGCPPDLLRRDSRNVARLVVTHASPCSGWMDVAIPQQSSGRQDRS